MAGHWRSALVTGASSGIGAALSERLAAEGVEVVLAARRAALLTQLAARIEAAGGRARVLELDVADPEATVRAVRAVDEAVGGLDLVVANAGVGRPQSAHTLTWEKTRDVFAVNFMGAMATLTAVLPRMVERGRGHLVGVSSVAVYSPTQGASAYRATKSGLTAFLENLRAELGGSGVHTTAVHPGFIRTPMADAFDIEPPEVWSAERAAAQIVRQLAKAPARIDFPFATVMCMRSLGALPSPLRDPIVRRIRLGGD